MSTGLHHRVVSGKSCVQKITQNNVLCLTQAKTQAVVQQLFSMQVRRLSNTLERMCG